MLNPVRRLAVPKHVTADYIFSSATKNGATKSQDGSVFTVQLDRPIQVPLEATACKLEFLAGWVWNTVPNITEENNHFRINTGVPTTEVSNALQLGYNNNPPNIDHYYAIDASGVMRIWGEVTATSPPFPTGTWTVGDSVRLGESGPPYTVLTVNEVSIPGDIDYVELGLQGSTPVVGDFTTRTGDPVNFPTMVYRLRDIITPQWLDVYVVTGTYELGRLNQVLQGLLIDLGVQGVPIEFILNIDTGKMTTLLFNDTQIDLTVNASPAEILGLQKQIYSVPPGSPSPYPVAVSTPEFNKVNQFHIHCDLVDRGIGVNSRHTDVVGVIPIQEDNSVGFVISYEPNTPTLTNINQLRGTIRRDVRCWLTNEKDEFLNTGGEDWSFHIRLSYLIPPLQPLKR